MTGHMHCYTLNTNHCGSQPLLDLVHHVPMERIVVHATLQHVRSVWQHLNATVVYTAHDVTVDRISQVRAFAGALAQKPPRSPRIAPIGVEPT